MWFLFSHTYNNPPFPPNKESSSFSEAASERRLCAPSDVIPPLGFPKPAWLLTTVSASSHICGISGKVGGCLPLNQGMIARRWQGFRRREEAGEERGGETGRAGERSDEGSKRSVAAEKVVDKGKELGWNEDVSREWPHFASFWHLWMGREGKEDQREKEWREEDDRNIFLDRYKLGKWLWTDWGKGWRRRGRMCRFQKVNFFSAFFLTFLIDYNQSPRSQLRSTGIEESVSTAG